MLLNKPGTIDIFLWLQYISEHCIIKETTSLHIPSDLLFVTILIFMYTGSTVKLPSSQLYHSDEYSILIRVAIIPFPLGITF